MAESEVTGIEDFERWKVASLKEYLSRRDISTDGVKKCSLLEHSLLGNGSHPSK